MTISKIRPTFTFDQDRLDALLPSILDQAFRGEL